MKDLSNEAVIHVIKDGIQYIQFRRLLEFQDKVKHCFTLKDLTFGDNSNFRDIENTVIDNYKKIAHALDINEKDVIRPYQTHTANVECVNDEKGIFIEKLKDVDGLLKNKKNEVLSLTFADCTPIFLYDYKKNIIGDIHSGWKGTLNKIGKNAVNKMIEIYGSNVRDIICLIGPTIRKCHFEVDEDVKDMFKNSHGDEIITIGEIKEGKQKYYIDTVKANINVMKEIGLRDENIIDSGLCTVCNSNIMHSYRVDKKNAGRSTALITLI